MTDIDLREGLRRPVMQASDRRNMQRNEQHLIAAWAVAYPPGTLVERCCTPGEPRRVASAPRMHPDRGPVVDVEGVYDRGLNCRAVPLCELTVLGDEPPFRGPIVTLYSARYALGIDDARYHVRVDTDVGPGEPPLIDVVRGSRIVGPDRLARVLEHLAVEGQFAATWAIRRATEALRHTTPPETEDDR